MTNIFSAHIQKHSDIAAPIVEVTTDTEIFWVQNSKSHFLVFDSDSDDDELLGF